MDQSKNDLSFLGWIAAIGGIVFMLGVVLAIGQLCWQTFDYLRTGAWDEWPALRVLYEAKLYPDWLVNPTGWFGLHELLVKFLVNFSIGFAMIAVGLPISIFCMWLEE